MGDKVVVDLDNDKVGINWQDTVPLPSRLRRFIKEGLETIISGYNMMMKNPEIKKQELVRDFWQKEKNLRTCIGRKQR